MDGLDGFAKTLDEIIIFKKFSSNTGTRKIIVRAPARQKRTGNVPLYSVLSTLDSSCASRKKHSSSLFVSTASQISRIIQIPKNEWLNDQREDWE